MPALHHASLSDDFRRSIDQGLTSDGFLQQIHGAELKDCRFRDCVGIGGDHQDRDRFLPMSEFFQKVDSSLPRHSIVADDEVELVNAQRVQRLIHILCRLDRVALSLQDFLDRAPAGSIVVRD
jgi:hypothetical protein